MSTKPPPTPRAVPRRARRQYTERERAQVVAIANVEQSQPIAAALTGVPQPTIAHWALGTRGTIPQAAQYETNQDAGALWTDIFRAYAKRSLETVESTKGQQAVTSAAIAFDKARLAYGLPTTIVQTMPDVVGALGALGIDPHLFFARIIARAEEEAGYKRLASDTHNRPAP